MTGLTPYFCNPHAPWQRGTIENVNRWLRRVLPRKIPLEHYAAEDLDDALRLYNTTPRKSLGYRTPWKPSANNSVLHLQIESPPSGRM